MTIRKYSSRAQQSTLSSPITSTATTMTVGSGPNLMGGKTPAVGETYTVVIDPDTALEEIVDVSNYASGNTLTITRGIDGSSGVAHSAGAIVRHMVIGRDLTEANNHTEATLAAHAATTSTQLRGVISDETGTGSLVFGTSPTIATATLTTPTMSAPIMTGTATAANLTASGTVTAALFSGPLTGAVTGNITGNVTGNVTGTVIGGASLNLPLVGGTMSGAIAMGANKITGLGTPTANTTDAANTAYVDAAITTAVTNVIASAPALLDTLDELAAALGDDANFATTVTNNLAAKAPLASPALTGVPTAPTASSATNTTQIATTAFVQANLTSSPSNLTGPITSIGSATTVAAQTGTGSTFVMNTSPTLVTPVLGVATATSVNGTTIPSSATLVKTADTLAILSSTTSAQLAGVISDETGTGALVFGTAPTLQTITVASDGTTDGNIVLNCTANSHGQKIQAQPHAQAATNTLLLPGGTTIGNANAVLVSDTGTQTLTNKTLTTPILGVATATSINGTTIPSSKTLVATDSTDYVVPSQTGNSGKFLTTNGTVSSWGVVDALPSQAGNAGKFLTTNGTTASFAPIITDPTPSIFMLMGA